ncbi:S53 family peptidase [Actinoallomurus sp. NPDC050550]|uniref:S53 family peptidase n=1 Tax=Actinoallomurus sp. NPDC050550 TaxID=3154937 RepID=UPI0033EC520A
MNRRQSPRRGALLGTAVCAAALLAGGSTRADTGPRPADTSTAAPSVRNACGTPSPGRPSCMAVVRTSGPAGPALAATSPAGYGPADLQAAYRLTSAAKGGAGQTIAIVDAFDDPNAEADLAVYRRQYGLPPCTEANGCFHKVNQRGAATPLPSPDSGWALEESLDIQMASAVCPNCHILLVEADDNQDESLGASVDTAARLHANAISNSYGEPEYVGVARMEGHFDHPGIAVTASSGDSGLGVGYPAASAHVIAVGGTTLWPADNARGWQETAWWGAGSGCSTQIAKPAWQTDKVCTHRTVADVAAVADPFTGVAVHDTYGVGGWVTVGGTSASSPIIAAVYALAGNAATVNAAAFPYAHRARLFDITSGTNAGCYPAYLCTAGRGYDGPTGLGTPNGTDAF